MHLRLLNNSDCRLPVTCNCFTCTVFSPRSEGFRYSASPSDLSNLSRINMLSITVLS